ncbi:hypothetical protein HY612_03620 [Candidatus Roizmanbacteria bacterium]|nr:hypothetical protein [Candidatus Roizmanbacteria bacterium]
MAKAVKWVKKRSYKLQNGWTLLKNKISQVTKTIELHKKYTRFKKKVVAAKKLLVFYFYFVRLRILNYFRYDVYFFLRIRRFFLGTVLYFSLLFVAAYFFDLYIHPELLNSDAVTFFTATGAMVGGILAIIFSLNILLMDKAEKIPVGFYDIAAKDRVHNAIYILISACSLTLFAFAVAHGTLHLGLSKYLLEAALLLVGIVFYLVFILYQRVLNRLNPNFVLGEVHRLAINELNRIKSRAEEISRVLEKNPTIDKTITKQTILAKSYQYLRPDIYRINASLNYLYDYHDRLTVNREHSSAESVLQIIEAVLTKYFEVRKESSVVLPSSLLLATTSDSKEFLTPVLERLLAIGEEYMRNNSNTGITKVVRVFRDLCIVASDIKYVLGRQVENPIFAQCRGYLDQLIDSAVKFKSLEGLFQGAVVYKDLGIIAVRKNLVHEITPIYDSLEEIAIGGLLNNQEAVLSESVSSYNGILVELVFSSSFNLEIELKGLLGKIENIIYLAFISVVGGGLRGNYLTQTTLAQPFETLRGCVYGLAKKIEEKDIPNEMRGLKSAFLNVVEETRITLRSLSEKMKNADHLLINTFGHVISDIGELLLDLSINPKWNLNKRELESQTAWYIHQPEWFTHDVQKINSNLSFDSLVEAVAKIGMKGLQVGNVEIAIEAEKIIMRFAVEMLEKEDDSRSRFGFTEPRIMERACYVGILALKLGKTGAVEALKPLVIEFETAYITKWFPDDREPTSPKKNQLMLELIQLSNEAGQYQASRILDNSRERVLELVNRSDIENFIFTIWNVRIEQ